MQYLWMNIRCLYVMGVELVFNVQRWHPLEMEETKGHMAVRAHT